MSRDSDRPTPVDPIEDPVIEALDDCFSVLEEINDGILAAEVAIDNASRESEQRHRELSGHMTALSAKFTAMDNRITTIMNRLDPIARVVQRAQRDESANAQNVAALRTQVDEMKRSFEEFRAKRAGNGG